MKKWKGCAIALAASVGVAGCLMSVLVGVVVYFLPKHELAGAWVVVEYQTPEQDKDRQPEDQDSKFGADVDEKLMRSLTVRVLRSGTIVSSLDNSVRIGYCDVRAGGALQVKTAERDPFWGKGRSVGTWQRTGDTATLVFGKNRAVIKKKR